MRFQQNMELLEKKKDVLTNKEIELSKREAQLERSEREIQAKDRRVEQRLEEARQTVEPQSRHEPRRGQKKRSWSRCWMTQSAHRPCKSSRSRRRPRRRPTIRAKRIVGIAIQRYGESTCRSARSRVVQLPSDDMKGRIIGREGRKIRALEAATGVDLVVDDTPETVVLSGFDPVRREIARLSLEKLIQDGRIHPTRIEEIVSKTQVEVEKSIKEAGEQASWSSALHGFIRRS